jgi:excisionase family DNA binding protein
MTPDCAPRRGDASQQFAVFRSRLGTIWAQSGAALQVPTDRLLTVREVAARLGVCTSTVYKLCAEGKLAHIRLSNAIRIAPDAVATHCVSSDAMPK